MVVRSLLLEEACKKKVNRPGSAFPKVSGNAASINNQADNVLRKILTDPTRILTRRHHPRHGYIREIRIFGGIGVRFSDDGTKFINFLEPGQGP